MSHDAWAAFASVELARHCLENADSWFRRNPPAEYQSYATRDPSPGWPLADGAVEVVQVPTGYSGVAAVEFKRTNESIHGILTGIGQVQAYLHKGFAAAVLVLPSGYSTKADPGEYAAAVLDTTPDAPIGVFVYDEPDLTSTSPFYERMRCVRPVRIDTSAPVRPGGISVTGAGRQRTQWAHVREGSTVPDPFYRYLQAALDTKLRPHRSRPQIRPELEAAASRLNPDVAASSYLSYTSEERPKRAVADEAWRRFWFSKVVTPAVQLPWRVVGGRYEVERASTELITWDGDPIVFFARADGVKASAVTRLNAMDIDEDDAWEMFAENIHDRAHQYREDLDSGLEAAGLIDPSGDPTELGFKFVQACDRARSANDPQPVSILRWAFLTEGGLLAFLHYVHSITHDMFDGAPLAFTTLQRVKTKRGDKVRAKFDSVAYRTALADVLADDLHVAARSAIRGGRRRPPLEGEVITLRQLGLVGDFRLGVGLEINWPAVHAALDVVGG